MPLIPCLLGPTASGKTAAALALANATKYVNIEIEIEIISIDSALIYRGMDIGTAKPTLAERACVPHHLIDILDPAQAYSVAQFRTDALRLIDEILARRNQPLLVGGTMLYYKALMAGLNQLPAANVDIRAVLEDEAAREGWPALHARLARYDPASAARISCNDAQRIQRALEVWQLTGQPMSTLLSAPRNDHKPLKPSTSSYRFALIALAPSDRNLLRQRIAQRFSAMLAAGFIDEVAQLRTRRDLHPGLPSMRCVGYRQIWSYLNGEIDKEKMQQMSVIATYQLSKRQLTWLRALDKQQVIDCCAPDATSQVICAVLNLLG